MFQLGLFGKKSNHTQTDLPGVARDEQQEIKVVSNANPSVQVSLCVCVLHCQKILVYSILTAFSSVLENKKLRKNSSDKH